MGNIRFGAPRELVLWLRDTFKVKTFVETGTNRADTTVWASGEFEKVITVEGFEPLYQEAVNNFGERKNITFLLGDSRDHIRDLSNTITEPAIFWLDAHWCGEHTFGSSDECPVMDELQALIRSAVPHFILIDDARLFLAPPPRPHQADHWPDIARICEVLTQPSANCYVAVQDDVIIAVPASAKLETIEFLRDHETPKATVELNQPKLRHRIRQRLGL